MQNDTPNGNGIVPGSMVPGMGSAMGSEPDPVYAPAYPAAVHRPIMDANASAKITPQIMALLVYTGLVRHWKWALPLGLVFGAAAAGILYFVFPIRYEATAWIQVQMNKPYYIYEEKQRDYKSFVNTQIALMKSPLIIDKALENPRVAQRNVVKKQKDRGLWLASNLILSTQQGSEMITVAFETDEPEDAEEIVNSVVNAFFDYYDAQASEWNVRMINQLNLELNRQQNAARLLQDEIRTGLQVAARHGAGPGNDGKPALGFTPGESIQRDLYLYEAQLEALKAELISTQQFVREGTTNIPSTVLMNAIQNDPNLVALIQQKGEIESRLERLKVTLYPDDPQIRSLETRRRQIDEKIEEYQTKLYDTKGAELRRTISANMEQKVWELENSVRTQEILVTNLRERYQDQLRDVKVRTVEVADVSFQQEQLKRINAVLDLLQTRVVSLQTEMSAPAQIQLKKKAALPKEAKIKKRLPMMTIGGMACFLFPFLLGIAIERMKPRLYHVSQIRMSTPGVMLGEIMEPPVSWIQGTTFRKRMARYKESVHSWCTHLLLSDPFRRCRSIALASVAGDDGKTFLAVQVAVAMAQMKEGKVLLIDGDMRVGRMHLLFGNEESGVGLADVLSFRNKPFEAIVMNEKEPNLELLSAGHLDVSPYELLGDGRFRELLDMLENQYELVLVVVPPIANAAESLLMAASCDSTLLCVRQGETVLAAMEDVFRKLVNTGSAVDGVVVKDIPYYQMAGKDGGFADKLEQVRLAHLLQYSD